MIPADSAEAEGEENALSQDRRQRVGDTGLEAVQDIRL
jgi:hypothetical protein